jgi:hypothetical protein
MLRGVTEEKKRKKTGRLLTTWYLGVFQKKLGTKLFIFTVKIKFHLILVLLGHRVHFRGQKVTFWSNHPDYNFQSKTVKFSYFTLEKSFFFIFKQFFFINVKVAQCCEGSLKKNKKKRSLIDNMVFGGFPKKIRNKTFLFLQ